MMAAVEEQVAGTAVAVVEEGEAETRQMAAPEVAEGRLVLPPEVAVPVEIMLSVVMEATPVVVEAGLLLSLRLAAVLLPDRVVTARLIRLVGLAPVAVVEEDFTEMLP
jgi:hypothetical protein